MKAIAAARDQILLKVARRKRQVTKVFGLTARGVAWLTGTYADYPCKYVFATREAAEAEITAFIERVCKPTDKDLDCLKRGTVKVEVFEYEVKQ